MKNILILGCDGMLGSQVVEKFKKLKNAKVYVTYRKNIFIKYKNVKFIKFDATKPESLSKYKNIFHYVINCIGIIKPYIDEKNSDSVYNSTVVNSILPYRLSKIFNKKKTKIYQIATDCVFSGKVGSYKESDKHDCVDVYGKTKSLGEIKTVNFYNIRCSIIGRELKNKLSLLEWFLKTPYKKKINGFSNHAWNGVTTNAFAEVIKTIIEKNIDVPKNFHLVPKNVVNKFDLLKILQKKYKRDDIKIAKINSKEKINRTIATIYKDINKKILLVEIVIYYIFLLFILFFKTDNLYN
jgi:dTDP-4-dehydrorhamnose reductase